MDEQTSSNIPVLQRHRYPRWVWIVGVVIVATLLYSLTMLPNYAAAARDIRSAQTAYKKTNFDSAIQHYLSALSRVPSSRVARIGASKAIFINADKSDDLLGLNALEGLLLNSSEWSELKQVMPAEYQQYFQETK